MIDMMKINNRGEMSLLLKKRLTLTISQTKPEHAPFPPTLANILVGCFFFMFWKEPVNCANGEFKSQR